MKDAHERAENEAWLVVRDTYAKKQKLALAYDTIASLVVVIIYVIFITKLGARDVIDRRTGQLAKQPGGMPVAAVLLIAIMIIPSVFFAVPSNDAKIESYKNGEFKIYFDAYAEEGTDEANAVAFLKEGRETVDKGLAELDEQIEKATDEKVKADLIFAREDGQRMLNLIDDNIEILTTSKSDAISTGTTMSIILLILCVAYIIAPNMLDKALAGVFAKNEAFEAQNVEEKKDEE